MSGWVEDDNGKVHCPDCWHGACRPPAAACDRTGCQCPCRDRAQRAAQLDDRPAETLAGLARDMAAESRPSALDLHAERFGHHRTLAAERIRRAA